MRVFTLFILTIMIILDISCLKPVFAKQADSTTAHILTDRKNLFEQMSMVTQVPWYYFAAIDQYDRTMLRFTKNKKTNNPTIESRLITPHFSPAQWSGPLNPDEYDTNPISISFFGGIGEDGSGDGIADWNNDIDVLYTEAKLLLRYGLAQDDFNIALWRMYQNPRSVTRIDQFSKIYEAFDTMELTRHAFPLPLRSRYSYRNTWGAKRGWGGRRIHEGTDLFASYGVPVRSTCYGIIEMKGWNRYGGWRVGIRSLNNVYHYYAHLSGFNKKQKAGDVVKPGDVIGWVGSSGYGKKGTQGKFPPHLHYGLYRDFGLSEWSFNPYPYLRKWERATYKRRKK